MTNKVENAINCLMGNLEDMDSDEIEKIILVLLPLKMMLLRGLKGSDFVRLFIGELLDDETKVSIKAKSKSRLH